MKNILYRYIDGQTHLGMPRGAIMSSSPMKQNRLFFIHLQTLPLGMHYKWKEIIDSECKTTNQISWGQITDKKSY